MEGWIFYVTSLIIIALLGRWIINKLISSDYDINSPFAIFLFCLTFSLSVVSLELVIFDIMGVGSEDNRKTKWLITLWMLVIICTGIIPAILVDKLTTKISSGNKVRSICVLLYTSMYIFSLYVYFGQVPNLPVFIDLITIIGTRLIAVLSGFGAVNCPFAYFQFISMNINQVREVKREIINNIYFILNEIEKSAINVAQLQFMMENTQPAKKENNKPGFLSRLFSYIPHLVKEQSDDTLQIQKDDLQNEILQLKEIHKDFFECIVCIMVEVYKEYVEEENRYKFSRSLYGKFLKKLAWAVSIYCVYKMLMSIFNFVIGRKKSMDPVNRILKIILPFFGCDLEQKTYETLAVYGTFIFMGYLMVSNVRSFSLNLVNMFNSFMGIALLQKMPSDILVLFLAEIFGIYLVSTVVLVQTSLPDRFLYLFVLIITHRANLKEITKNIDILGHYKFFDFYFVISGMISFVIIFFNHKKRKQKLQSFERQKDNL